jgi:hypothetical protein
MVVGSSKPASMSLADATPNDIIPAKFSVKTNKIKTKVNNLFQ